MEASPDLTNSLMTDTIKSYIDALSSTNTDKPEITDNGKQIFVTGHSEYDADTLKNEYLRDLAAGINPNIPENYFPNDDDTQKPKLQWRSHCNNLYTNWLNYFVYQTTPYDIMNVGVESTTF